MFTLPGYGLFKERMTQPTGIEFLISVLEYIVHAAPTENISYEELTRTVDDVFPHIGATIMSTMADILRQKGLEPGILLNAREAVLENLEVRFGDVPLPLKEEVQGISDPVFLKHLHRQAIQVPSLEDFETLLEKSPA